MANAINNSRKNFIYALIVNRNIFYQAAPFSTQGQSDIPKFDRIHPWRFAQRNYQEMPVNKKSESTLEYKLDAETTAKLDEFAKLIEKLNDRNSTAKEKRDALKRLRHLRCQFLFHDCAVDY
jgi:hypothetical protein